MKLWLWAVPLLASVGYVAAQSGPHWPQDYLPGVGEIERAFEAKVDLNGTLENGTVNDTAIGGASTINLNLPWSNVAGSLPTSANKINVGGYPVSGEIPANVTHAFVADLMVPANYTQAPWPPAAVAAHTLSANTAGANTSLAYFGFSGQTVSGVDPYGSNIVVANCPTITCPANTGFDGNWIGHEIDMNVSTKAGGIVPTGLARALYISGGGNTYPQGSNVAAIELNVFGPNLPWPSGIITDDGATTIALNIGALGAGVNQNSQQIVFHSRKPSGVTNAVTQSLDSTGNMLFTMPTGTAVSTSGHWANSSGTPALSACGTTPVMSGTTNDSAGTIAPGAGSPTSCVITFATPYASAPKCVASSATPSIGVGIISATISAITVGFASAFGAGGNFTYLCQQ